MSFTLVTGNTVSASPHFIIPGTFLSTNFDASYKPGELTINPKELHIKAEFVFSDDVSKVEYTFYDGFISFKSKCKDNLSE